MKIPSQSNTKSFEAYTESVADLPPVASSGKPAGVGAASHDTRWPGVNGFEFALCPV